VKRYRVRFTPRAQADLEALFDFLAAKDKRAARQSLSAIRKGLTLLRSFPFSCRKSEGAKSSRWRELVVSFGHDGYVLLFEIEDARTVTVLAARHQREDDFLL
jgi:plasmid stabilization system protein ParE